MPVSLDSMFPDHGWASSALLRTFCIRSKPNKSLTRRREEWSEMVKHRTGDSDLRWLWVGWNNFYLWGRQWVMILICNIPEKQLSSSWVCDDSMALPGLKFRLQSPSAKKQRAVSTFILAELWNLRAGMGSWFSRLIIWPPTLLCPWHWVLFGREEDKK